VHPKKYDENMLAVFCSLIIDKDFWNTPALFVHRVIEHSSVMQMNKNYLEELEVFERLNSIMFCLPAGAAFISCMFIRKQYIALNPGVLYSIS